MRAQSPWPLTASIKRFQSRCSSLPSETIFRDFLTGRRVGAIFASATIPYNTNSDRTSGNTRFATARFSGERTVRISACFISAENSRCFNAENLCHRSKSQTLCAINFGRLARGVRCNSSRMARNCDSVCVQTTSAFRMPSKLRHAWIRSNPSIARIPRRKNLVGAASGQSRECVTEHPIVPAR